MTRHAHTDQIEEALLIRRLLDDSALRARFRRRPDAVARAHGLDDLADQLARDAGPLQTLDVRHSRSSLAGMAAAAAAEGVDALSLFRDLDPADESEGAQALRLATTLAGEPLSVSEPATGPRDLQAIPLRVADEAAAAEPADGLDAALERYPGDDAPREEIAGWMAACARRAGLPPELPIMAALVESELQNLDGGHADSVGYFQMRVSIWDQGAYAGYQDRPELQLRWFIDRALAEGRAREYGSPSEYGEWAANIERPAEQYRGRYQLRLDEARALIEAAPAAADAAPPPREQAEAAEPADSAVPARPVIHDTGPVRRRGGGDGDEDNDQDEAADADGDGGGSLGEQMVRIARGEVGVAETTTNDGEKVREYISAVPGIQPPAPWCACFVSWLAREAGSPLGPEGHGFAAVADVWAWAQSNDQAIPAGPGVEPRAGDLIVWDANPNVHGDEHIGIVEKVLPDGRIQTIEGNSGDHVARRVYPPGEGLGYVRLP